MLELNKSITLQNYKPMTVLIEILKPTLLNLLTSVAARKLLIDVLTRVAKQSDNEVDDALVEGLARALRVEG